MKEKGHISFDPRTVVQVNEPLANAYGLDLTDPAYIGYTYGAIKIEVIGGIDDVNLKSLRVTLKISKKGSYSPKEIYRSQQVDLFSEGQLEKVSREASERTKIEKAKLIEAFYDLTERLERYRRDQPYTVITNEPALLSNARDIKAAKSFLKKKDLLDSLKETLQQAGVINVELGLQLYLLGLSRLTEKPLHVVVQGKLLTASEFFESFTPIIPTEQLREITSISKNALSYRPRSDQWNHQTLLLHKLEGLFHNDSILQEYIFHGKVNRIVTETDRKNGTYRSSEKSVHENFQLMGYTSTDFHPVFETPSVVVLPIHENTNYTDLFYLREVGTFSGQTEHNDINASVQLLQDIQRHLKPYPIRNPYLDQVDLQAFFGSDVKSFRQFLWITSLITLLHQEQSPVQKQGGKYYLEVESEHMIAALECFQCLWLKPEEQLYYKVSGTFSYLKTTLTKKYRKKAQTAIFKKAEMRPKGLAPATFSRHLQTLEAYGQIKRVGGNNREGFDYQIVSWEDTANKTDLFNKLIGELKNLSNSFVSHASIPRQTKEKSKK